MDPWFYVCRRVVSGDEVGWNDFINDSEVVCKFANVNDRRGGSPEFDDGVSR